MEPTRLDQQRKELFHFVVWLLLVMLGVMTYVSFQQYRDTSLPWLTIVCLLACLYVVGRDRQLTRQRKQLRHDLVEEQDKSADLEGRLMELSGLYRAISAVNASGSPEGTFDTVLRSALDLVGGNRGLVMLFDEEDEYLVIAAAEGISEDVVANTRQRVGEGVAGWVVKNVQPVLLSGDVRGDERFENLADYKRVNYSISVPLVLRDDVLGVLNVGIITENTDQDFGDHELRLTTIFAQHASVAIENARLRLMNNVVISLET
jgi:transcriptional regulator with GAF, ATPase, and Fis domain